MFVYIHLHNHFEIGTFFPHASSLWSWHPKNRSSIEGHFEVSRRFWSLVHAVGTTKVQADKNYVLRNETCKGEENTRWRCQIFFIFTPTWGNDPIWLIFFKGVESNHLPEHIVRIFEATFTERGFHMHHPLAWQVPFPPRHPCRPWPLTRAHLQLRHPTNRRPAHDWDMWRDGASRRLPESWWVLLWTELLNLSTIKNCLEVSPRIMFQTEALFKTSNSFLYRQWVHTCKTFLPILWRRRNLTNMLHIFGCKWLNHHLVAFHPLESVRHNAASSLQDPRCINLLQVPRWSCWVVQTQMDLICAYKCPKKTMFPVSTCVFACQSMWGNMGKPCNMTFV